MIEILMMLALLSMAKKGSRRRRAGFFVVPVDMQLALLTLADETVLIGDLMGTTFDYDAFVISAELLITVRDNTAGEGPLYVGVAPDDYSVTQIKEKLEADVGGRYNLVEMEKARRKVRTFGYMVSAGTGEPHLFPNRTKFPIKWAQGSGSNLSLWVMNKSGASLTTGAVVEVLGNLYCRRVG